MQEQEFITKFEESKDVLKAWGDFVVGRIKQRVRELVSPRSEYLADSFFKVPPTYRVKELSSILDKAFRRNKGYEDPWQDITDKVGCRFVVLLLQDINTVCQAVESCPEWDYSLDRDFEKEKAANPEYFNYQSMHYVVRNRTFRPHRFLENVKGVLTERSVFIPPEITCEIQIRTLLQHAFSELTHDAIYKSPIKVLPDVRRVVSRCSALIETTDNMFRETKKSTDHVSETLDQLKSMTMGFLKAIGTPVDESEFDVYYAHLLYSIIYKHDLVSFGSYLEEYRPALAERLNWDSRLGKPHMLMFLYLMERCRAEFEAILRQEEIPYDEIEPVYVRLGISRPRWF